MCVCVQPCDPRDNFFLFLLSFAYMQGAWRSFPSHANEAMGHDWMGNWTQFPVPAKSWAPVPARLENGPCARLVFQAGFQGFSFFNKLIACETCQSHPVEVAQA